MCAHTLDIAQSLSMQPKSFHQKTCLASQVGCKIEILLSSRPRLLTRSVSLPAMSPGNQSPLLPSAGIFIDLFGEVGIVVLLWSRRICGGRDRGRGASE